MVILFLLKTPVQKVVILLRQGMPLMANQKYFTKIPVFEIV